MKEEKRDPAEATDAEAEAAAEGTAEVGEDMEEVEVAEEVATVAEEDLVAAVATEVSSEIGAQFLWKKVKRSKSRLSQ